MFGRGVGGDTAFVLGTGALGSYTTFSTWMFESERLVEAEQSRVAAANVGISLVAGLRRRSRAAGRSRRCRRATGPYGTLTGW